MGDSPLFRDDRDADVGVDFGMKADANRVLTDGLDGMVELDLPLIHRMALGGQRIGHVLAGDRTEELAFLACQAKLMGDASRLRGLGIALLAASRTERARLGLDPLCCRSRLKPTLGRGSSAYPASPGPSARPSERPHLRAELLPSLVQPSRLRRLHSPPEI
jgi:hypothetical protein